METGSTTAWTAYSAAARTTMPGTSMHQSQSQIQNPKSAALGATDVRRP